MMDSSTLAARWSTLRILWFALTVSHLTLAGVLWFIRFGPGAAGSTPPPDAPVDLFTMLFSGVALANAVLSVLLPRWQLRKRAQVLGVPTQGRLSDPQTALLLPYAQASLVLGLGLSESVSLFGFVLGFLGAKPLQFAPFFVTGFLLAAHRLPGDAWLRRELGASDVL